MTAVTSMTRSASSLEANQRCSRLAIHNRVSRSEYESNDTNFASVNQHHWNPRTAFHDRLKFFLSWFSFRRWYLSGWRPCSKTCGKGIQLRTIVCRRKKSQEHYETVEESSCTEQKPVGNLQQECNMIACCSGWMETFSMEWGKHRRRSAVIILKYIAVRNFH